MPKQRLGGVNLMMEGVIMPTKIRKRGCSSSSSSSSRIHHYRLNKRAIVVARSRGGLGRSRSGTPMSGVDSPKSGKSTQPVSARRLAASLWEMKSGSNTVFKREKMQSGWGLLLHSSSDSLPPNFSDPSHSPTVSEVDRSGIGSERRTPSISRRLRAAEQNDSVFDSVSHASATFMETESRSRPPTSSGSVSGGRNRLKDVSNALTTSKELVKIINRIWGQTDQPSSRMSVISALHAELERARMQVNHLMQEQTLNKTDINNLIKCFAEEKMSWKNKEHRAVEAAIASIADELEVERKLRRRLESLNKKLGKELTEMQSSFTTAVKELEREKRAREITEQVCDELARNVDEDRAQVEKLQEEAEKEREMLELADKLREGRVQMKLSEAKHQFEEKSSAISKLRKQLEVFLRAKRDKDEDRAACLMKSSMSSHPRDDREVEDAATNSKADSAESDHQLIEFANKSNTSRIHKWAHGSAAAHEIKTRNSAASSRSSTTLQRTISDHEPGDGLNRQRLAEHEKEGQRRSYMEETQRYKAVRGVHDHVLSSPRSSLTRDCYSPSSHSQQRRSKW